MGLFDRISNPQAKEVKLSEKLAKQRDALAAKWPAVLAEWERLDREEVRPCAEELAVVLHTQNGEKILQAREALKLAIWRRDGLKADHDRALRELSAGIEVITGPTIFARAQEWQNDLLSLRKHKLVEVDDRFIDVSKDNTPRMVKFRSNSKVLTEVKVALLDAIRTLRDMRSSPLSEVLAFIESTESKLKKLDLAALSEEGPVTESRFAEIIAEPEMIVRPAPGSTDRITERFFRT